MLKMKLNYHDQSDWVWSVMKTSEDNDMIEHICLVYTEIEIELSRIILPGAICDENQKGHWRD